jgi:hypothetical protein
MPFPLSPVNGQQTTLNGVTYEYSSSNGTWTKIPATVVPSIDQVARDKANSASSNTIYTQGVDTTQNTRIQAAFDKANNASPMLKVASINSSNVYSNIVSNVSTIAFDSFTGFHVDNMGEGNVKISLGSTFSTWNVVGQGDLNAVGDDIIRINGANGIVITTNPSDTPYKSITFNGKTIFDKANSAYNMAEAADILAAKLAEVNLTQNTSIQAAFDKANSANVLAQAAFNAANAASSSVDQYARDTANSASSNTIYTQGVDTTQNTRITAIDSYAGSSYAQANAANNLAQSSFNKANSANVLAQASFDNANTKLNSSGGTISGDLTVTGNLFVSGNTTTYTSNNVVINDPIILLANNNTGNALDVGFVAHYIENDILKHTGLVKDVSTNTWYLFDNYTPEIQGTNLLNPNDTSLRISTVKANLISNSVFISGYDALAYTQASFNKANTAASDITIIQGVNTTQNTNITYATNLAQSAFDHANAAFNQANTGGGSSLDQYARDTANGAVAVNITQNTNITHADTKAQAAFDKANSANVLAQAAFNQANTGGGGSSLDQYARDTANSASSNTIIIQGVNTTQNTNITHADTKAQAAFEQANLALTTAVAVGDSVTIIQGVNLTQNTNITHADTKAQAAFDKANTASSNTIVIQGVDDWQNTRITAIDSFVTGSFNKSNSAFDKANSANVLAQAAFNQANTASSNTIYTQGVDTTQNTRLTSVETLAQAAFNQANTGGGGSSNSFATISVAGQSNVVADSSTDTLTLVAGSGISITTNESTDTITITGTGGGGGGGGIINDLSTTLSISSGSVTLNVAAYTIFSVTLNQSISNINITDVSSAPYISNFVLVVTYNGTEYNITWPESFRWADGVAPSLTTANGKKDIFSFFTLDGGTTYNAIIVGLNV